MIWKADDLSVRAANEKKFGLLDEANSKRSEANEMIVQGNIAKKYQKCKQFASKL